MRQGFVVAAVLAAAALCGCERQTAASSSTDLQPCRLPAVSREVLCGRIEVRESPLAQDTENARRIEIHFAVVPALAKNKSADPVFVLAGGPGQAATQVAGLTLPLFEQLNARRDIVFVDQRGTGKSNPLECEPRRRTRVTDAVDPHAQIAELGQCLRTLPADTRWYATWVATRDLDAVRAALGADRINLWGGSYGTRAALDYMRQFPQHVRSVVLDGAAPADMGLPASFSVDADAALTGLVAACEGDATCKREYPRLGADLDALLQRFGRQPVSIDFIDPLSGAPQTIGFTRDALFASLRAPLYAPPLAAALPHAIARASQRDYGPLLALVVSFTGNDALRLNWGMHFAVVCAEDLPRIDANARAAASATRFGTSFVALYDAACKVVPHEPALREFYEPPQSDAPVLVLSGGLDPATPPRHGESVAARLKNSRHVIAPHLGHGISAQGCAPELVTRFIRTASFDRIDGQCLVQLPRPTFFAPVQSEAPAASPLSPDPSPTRGEGKKRD